MKRKPSKKNKGRCTKMAYSDGPSARKAAKQKTNACGIYHRAYKCNKCDKWHHTTEKLRDRRKRK